MKFEMPPCPYTGDVAPNGDRAIISNYPREVRAAWDKLFMEKLRRPSREQKANLKKLLAEYNRLKAKHDQKRKQQETAG